jgi:hypothetical protein
MNDDYIFTSAIRPQDLFGPTCAGAKNATFGSHLYIYNDHFTKTGSGQTYRENTLKQDDYLLLTVFLRSFFECFPYVCPEPVLVNSSFLCINGSKRPFSYLAVEADAVNVKPALRLAAVTLDRAVVCLELQLLGHALGVELAVPPLASVVIAHAVAQNLRVCDIVLIVQCTLQGKHKTKSRELVQYSIFIVSVRPEPVLAKCRFQSENGVQISVQNETLFRIAPPSPRRFQPRCRKRLF